MNFNVNAADFDAPGTEIVLRNNEGLDDVNELPFGNDYEDEAPIHRGTSFFGRNRNKLIIFGMTAAVVLFVSGTSIAVSHNNRIASNFNTLPKACKVSKSKAPKLSKAPKQSKAPKVSKAPTPQGTPSPSPMATAQGTPSPIVKTSKAPKESKAPKTKAPTIICTKSPTSIAPKPSIAPKTSKVPKIRVGV
mmetsp:Transcript_13160/g.21617  ORF Transcript_13160/g.21617 Transcript_13160/m.21617 type:complete len:191 (-) Transcript_13160:274-846(-)